MNKIDKIGRKLMKRYPNMVGYSKGLRLRIRKGKVVDEEVIQVHVDKKKPLRELRAVDLLPKDVDGFSIDVVEKGDYHFLQLTKMDVIRPLVGGISVGNKGITAGTICDFMEKLFSPDKNETFVTSNGHIIADDPLNSPAQVVLKDIVQPGRSPDGGTEVVAKYYWHQQLFPDETPSECGISISVTEALNFLSASLHRQSRFYAFTQQENHLDFGVARIEEHIQWKYEHFDVVFDPNRFQFAGIGFAGSNVSSLGCYSTYIKDAGYWPSRYEMALLQAGDTLHKTGRTSCYTVCLLTDPSVTAKVNMGGGMYVLFDNVFSMPPMLEGGDSGSGFYKEVMP